MAAYFARRLLLMIPTMLGISLIAFSMTRLVPGGPVEQYLAGGQGGGGEVGGGPGMGKAGQGMTEAQLKDLKAYFNLDKPWYVAYPEWLSNVFRGDFGDSSKYQKPTLTLIKDKMPISLTFGLCGFLFAYLVSIPLGIIKALRHGEVFDFATSFIVFIGYSIPGWALGTLLLLFFAQGKFMDVLPLGDERTMSYEKLPDTIKAAEPREKVTDDFGILVWEKMSVRSKLLDTIWHMFLPVLCYMAGSFATLTILTKNSLMENLGKDYVRTAYAKGLSPTRVIFLHTLRNSLIPLATGLGHAVSIVMAGSYLIEFVFNIDGIGYLGFTAIKDRDYTLVMAILTINTTLVLFGNILSDVLYAVIDPRIRFE